MSTPPLAHLATPGTTLEITVRPSARRNAVALGEDGVRVETTATPEGGKANRAVTRLLARALGIAPSRLTLLHGASGRRKLFAIAPD